MDKIYDKSEKIDFNNLTYHCKGENLARINFIGFRGLLHNFENIKNGNVWIEKVKKNQKQF